MFSIVNFLRFLVAPPEFCGEIFGGLLQILEILPVSQFLSFLKVCKCFDRTLLVSDKTLANNIMRFQSHFFPRYEGQTPET